MLKKQCTKREYDKEISQIVKKAGNVLYEQAEKNMLSYHQFLSYVYYISCTGAVEK